MTGRLVVHSIAPDATDAGEIARRLAACGVTVLDRQNFMMLVEGGKTAIRKALDEAHGWELAPLKHTPPPRLRPKVSRRP
jgi:hypothetical protein